MGIITATIIVLSQLFWFQATDFNKKKAVTEQEDANQREEAHISLPSSSIPSGTSVEQGQESSFIQDLFFEEEKASEVSTLLPAAVDKFFHTLFRVLIAPNAP